MKALAALFGGWCASQRATLGTMVEHELVRMIAQNSRQHRPSKLIPFRLAVCLFLRIAVQLECYGKEKCLGDFSLLVCHKAAVIAQVSDQFFINGRKLAAVVIRLRSYLLIEFVLNALRCLDQLIKR